MYLANKRFLPFTSAAFIEGWCLCTLLVCMLGIS